MLTSFDQILAAVAEQPRKRLAVVNAASAASLRAALAAQQQDLADPVLFGDPERIRQVAEQEGLDLSGAEVIEAPGDLQAARQATAAVHDGRADLLMKGLLHTDDFLRAVLDKETGLRTGSIMSHVFLLELPDRLVLVSDGAMNIAPDLVTKAAIIMNAVYLANVLGLSEPKVGILAATELVNPNMPATLEAAALASMEHRGQFPTCCVDGPFALDNAVSLLAAQVKGIPGPVAGRCDVLIVPSIEAGNMLAKSFAFLGGGRVAGVLVGAAAPVVLTSRADSDQAMLHSIAIAVLMAQMKRDSRLKIGKVRF